MGSCGGELRSIFVLVLGGSERGFCSVGLLTERITFADTPCFALGIVVGGMDRLDTMHRYQENGICYNQFVGFQGFR